MHEVKLLLENFVSILLSLAYNCRKSIVFNQTSEIEILIDLNVLKSPESTNHIFSLCSECVSIIRITQNKLQEKILILNYTSVS